MRNRIQSFVTSVIRWFHHHPQILKFLAVFVLLGVLLYAIGATIRYYFYSDDYSILYYVQRNRLIVYPYNWEYLAVFKPLYQIFGVQPLGYFAFGVLTYLLATVSVGALFYILTRRSGIAYITSLIFATGYIGIEQFNMMLVSITNNLSIVGIAGVLITYCIWLQFRQFRYYIVSLCIFFLSLLLFPFRTFTLILFVPTLELLYGVYIRKWNQTFTAIIYSLLSLLPFYLIGKNSGVFEYGGNGSFGIKTIIEYTRPAMLEEYIANFGRMILPNQILAQVKLFPGKEVHVAAGIIVVVIVAILGCVLWRRKSTHNIHRHVFFALALTLEGYAGIFLLQPSFGIYGPISRYLPITFIGFSSLFPIIFWALGILLHGEKNTGYRVFSALVAAGYVFILATASDKYVLARVKEQGFPAAKFMSQLKKYIPVFPKYATIYIDSADYYPATPRLGNILSNALFTHEVTFAVLYDVPMERVKFTLFSDEYMRLLKQSTNPEGKFYSFYYDGVNLRDTTKDIKFSLRSDQARVVAEKLSPTVISNTKDILTIPLSGIPSFGEQQLELTLRFSPLDPAQFTYPYFFGNPTETQKNEIYKTFDQKRIDREAVFSYLIAREEYYKTVKATGSESNYLYPQNFLVDNRVDTWWLDAENLWELKPTYKQSFVIDLGKVKQNSRVLWIPMQNREASVYYISMSEDNATWQSINAQSSRVTNGDSILVSDTFAPTWARYVKYEIEQTRNGETPSMRELEVVENAYSSTDPLLAWRMGNAPFEYIKNQEELSQVYDYVAHHGVAKIFTKTNKENVLDNKYFVSLPVFVDGQTHTYTVPISSRGTSLEKIGIEVAYPTEVSVEQVRILQFGR